MKRLLLTILRRTIRVGVATVAGSEAAALVPTVSDAVGIGAWDVAAIAGLAAIGKGLRHAYPKKSWLRFLPF